MTRPFCRFTLRQVVSECLPMLRTLERVGVKTPFHKRSLSRVLDVLHNAANTFDEDEASNYYEDEYLACLDARGFVCEAVALGNHGIATNLCLSRAVRSLERIESSRDVA